MIAIKIENNMDCNNICKQTQNLVTEYMKEHGNNINNLVLVLQVKEVVDSTMDYTKKLNIIES
jgi:hypothetical protein